jgi:choline dehydrogenase-like flavoprotein
MYGYILEVPPAHPGLLGLSLPWRGAYEYRELMARAAYFATFIVITRDKGEGTVTINRHGEAEIEYVTSVFDRRHLLHGLRQAARMHRALGAEGITSLQNRPTLTRSVAGEPLTDEQLNEFERRLERHGLGPNQIMLFSAHQMGSCRAGADPHRAVVDERQQVYGVKNLYVCDSSVFPSALGVNPMLTIMALAHRAAQEIKREC